MLVYYTFPVNEGNENNSSRDLCKTLKDLFVPEYTTAIYFLKLGDYISKIFLVLAHIWGQNYFQNFTHLLTIFKAISSVNIVKRN